MTRITVALEGATVNNCVIMPGALRVEDDVVPVNWNGVESSIIGKARDMQRDGNAVTMEVELNEDVYLDLEDKIGAYVYVQPFKADDHLLIPGALKRVTSGRIRAVSLHDLGE